jgi:hypothetical protein
MDNFYLIISVVAIVLLILLLTVIGIMMTNQTVASIYPPYQSQCPDYWTPNSDGTCSQSPSLNKIELTYNPNSPAEIDIKKKIIVTTTGTGNSATYKFDFTKNNLCSNREWAKSHSIEWDGVSNAANC